MRDRRHRRAPRIARLTLAALLWLPLAASPAAAQAGLTNIEDASTPPKNYLRFRPILAWTRYDSRFSTSGSEPLGASFTAESLGVANFAPLDSTQQLIRQAAQTGTAFRLNMGRSRMNATAREETLPFIFDYGITNRFAVTIVVPVVRRRLSTLFLLDSTGANVGPNLQRTNQTASQNNQLVQSEFGAATAALQAKLAACQADASGVNCAAVLAQGPALLSESQAFASTVAALYGSASSAGSAFVPRTESAEQAAVGTRVSDFNARFFSLLGTNFLLAVPVGAAGPAGSAEFQSFVVDDAAGDSLASQERLGLGDIEVGLKLRVIDRPIAAGRRSGLQVAVAAGGRFPTGSRRAASEIVDMRLGEGDPIVDVKAIADARIGRFGLLSVVHQGFRIGDEAPPVTTNGQVQANAKSLFEFEAMPRWHLSDVFALHGAYDYRKTDSSGDQLAGGGVTFMSSSARRPNQSPSMEARITHLEAITGEPGRPKFFREQLEVRIYYRLPR